jgi:hypothetical protein
MGRTAGTAGISAASSDMRRGAVRAEVMGCEVKAAQAPKVAERIASFMVVEVVFAKLSAEWEYMTAKKSFPFLDNLRCQNPNGRRLKRFPPYAIRLSPFSDSFDVCEKMTIDVLSHQ